jgi:hypothetical protein
VTKPNTSFFNALAGQARKGDASGFPSDPRSPSFDLLCAQALAHLRRARDLDDEDAAVAALEAFAKVLRAWSASMQASMAVEAAQRRARGRKQ